MPQFWLISVGYLFVALNLIVNGIELLLPSCFGYAMIAGGAWGLRDAQWVFKYVPIPAGLLAVITFPDLFRFSMPHHLHSFERWVQWPSVGLDVVLIGMVAWGLWHEAEIHCNDRLKVLAGATVPVVIASMAGWWIYPITSNANLLTSFLIFEIPAFYMFVVSGIAAKSFD